MKMHAQFSASLGKTFSAAVLGASVAFFAPALCGVATPALAAAAVAGLPDFTELVEKTGPAVVNIRTTEKIKASFSKGPEFDQLADGLASHAAQLADAAAAKDAQRSSTALAELKDTCNNVAYGNLARRGDRGLVLEAAALAGADRAIERLPDGWSTVLTRSMSS